MKIITFKIPATSSSTILANAVNMLESIPSIPLDVTKSSYVGSGISGERDVFVILPSEILDRDGFSIWSMELTIGGDLKDTTVFEIDNTVTPIVIDPAPIRARVEADISMSLVRALIDGRTEAKSGTETLVFNNDDVVIQKISIVGGARGSEFKGHILSWTGNSATLDTTAVMSHDNEGNQVWVRELTQEGVL